ncbi:MAG TPA: flagellar biosynthetic protein FliR [Spongiibacteraceae bacterium]|nr:flagellar biosynthetic protein FliR [Spongiibacteraceae bacterium]
MIEFDIAALQHWLNQFMWPLMRISGFCMVAPIFGAALVPPRVRLLFSLLLTLLIAPVVHDLPRPDFLSPASVILVAQQLLIGIGLAYFLQVLMQAFVTFGQIVAMQMGLGFASLNDPVNGVSVTAVSQLYLMLVTLLFLAVNGHLVMIDVLVESFRTLPVGADIGGARLQALLGWVSWMFAAGLLMALPAVTALLIINCSLGVITRAAPQLNIFAIGFPLMLVLGMLILWASIASVLPNFERYNHEALEAMRMWVS